MDDYKIELYVTGPGMHYMRSDISTYTLTPELQEIVDALKLKIAEGHGHKYTDTTPDKETLDAD